MKEITRLRSCLGHFELFIDLIWLEIIAKIAESFSEEEFDFESGVKVSDT